MVASNSSIRAIRRFTILIVNNNDLYQKTIEESLQVSFPTVAIEELADRGAAFGRVDAFLPDLIFISIELPGENGLELTKKIKIAHPNIAISILASYKIPEYREAALPYGANRFLGKASLNRRELEELVKSYQKV
jgi:DNA-binding NarL/FixJ family response regulator